MPKKRKLVNAASGSIDTDDSSDEDVTDDESLDFLKQSESQAKVNYNITTVVKKSHF